MARVKSFLKIKGSIGETTFREVGGNNYAQDKLNIPDSKRKEHEDFVVTRKNATEFGSAIKAAKLIRAALVDLLHRAADPKMVQYLNQTMMKIMGIGHIRWSLDPAALLPKNMALLLGHNFNRNVTLRKVFNTPYSATINRETGELTVNIPPLNPANCIIPPKQATHFKIVICGAEIDFAKHEQKHKTYSSEVMKLGENLTNIVSVTHQMTPASANVLFIALGIVFIDETKTYYSTDAQAKKVNPLCIVQLDLG